VETEILSDLQALRGEIRAHWETLLRLERATSPLAQPDTLVHLLETTLNEIFRDLENWSPRRHSTPAVAPLCPCGRNPLLAYFAAGRQALRDALVRTQSAKPTPDPRKRDLALACVDQVFNQISCREIALFCSVCQFRDTTPDQRGVLAVATDRLAG
jgi:hypothetical protein